MCNIKKKRAAWIQSTRNIKYSLRNLSCLCLKLCFILFGIVSNNSYMKSEMKKCTDDCFICYLLWTNNGLCLL